MRLLIAGGGTGGHLFPALAIARAVRDEDPSAEILFVGTRRGIENRIIPTTEFPIRFINARGLRGKGPVDLIKGAFQIPRGVIQSIGILREFKPGVVLGVGGYASGPTLCAALLLGIPTAIQEQNSVMGTTNRALSKLVGTVFTSWPHTEPAPSPSKTLEAGNPIRGDLLKAGAREDQSARLNLLVFGGSQGAQSINKSITENVGLFGPLSDRLSVAHQTGAKWLDHVRVAYQGAGLDADVRDFIDDMGSVYQWADLVVCRAGASSLAEITALGKPAIIIPYPFAIGDHQAKNAAVLESRGAAVVIPDSKLENGTLVKTICSLIQDPDRLKEMAEKSRSLGRPEAARAIATRLIEIARSHG